MHPNALLDTPHQARPMRPPPRHAVARPRSPRQLTSWPRRCAWLLVVGLLTGSAQAEWSPTPELRDRLSALDEAQAAFLTSGRAFDFMPRQQLEHEIATRDADGLERLVADIMDLADSMAYDPDRDMGAMPLNLASKRFNHREPTPPPLRDGEREPGPFSVHRYLFPQSGVPTFGGAKVAIFPEDLVAGDVDVAIVGVPSNMSSGRRDSMSAPDAMRALPTLAARDDQTLLAPLEVLSVVDYGNFADDGLSAERTADHVERMVTETAATGAVPMLVGGDTSLLYPGVKGVAAALGDESLGLLHLSAHPDANRRDAHRVSDDRVIFSLIDEGVVRGRDTLLLGLRGPAVTPDTLAWLQDRGVRYHTMTAIEQRGLERVMKQVLREVERGPERFYVSVDVSVLDPAQLVAAGRATPHGLETRTVTRALRRVCATKDIAGFEVTDLAPMLDTSPQSTLAANALLNACLVGMAVRAEGLDPDHVHPLVASHGQR